jgi:ABC-type transport system involved in multi-copper enzyme maturation permease subunit
MRSIWQSLAWKEWREHRWKLVAVLGVLLLSLTVLWSTTHEREFSSIQIALLMPILPLSVLIAATTAAYERSHGTMPFLSALPISQRRVAGIKLVAGLATCLVPVLLVLVLIFVWWLNWGAVEGNFERSMKVAADTWRGPFNQLNWFAATGIYLTLWIVSLFFWSAAAGVNRTDEVSAVAMSLALIAGIWAVFLAIAFSFGEGDPGAFSDKHRTLTLFASAVAPGGFPNAQPFRHRSDPSAWQLFFVFVLVHASLAAWFVNRFGRSAAPRIRSNRPEMSTRLGFNWLAPPRKSAFSAIAWKQLRESGPLAIAGLGGVALFVAAGVLVTLNSQRNLNETKDVAAMSAIFGSIFFGVLTSLVIGVGVFLRDLETGVHTFWRSRPIEPSVWYWIKFVTGLAIVALAFLSPLLIAPWLASEHLLRQSDVPWIQMNSAATMLAAYAIAAATTCLLRSAVFATVLTMAGLYIAAISPSLVVLAYRWATSPIRSAYPFEEGEMQPLVIIGLLSAALLATIAGWLAVRNNWSLRNGR